VLNGTVSWFGGPNDPTSGPTTASGSPISAGGIAVYNEATLGGYWNITFPNGHTVILKQTDIGPAPWTGRTIDVAYSSLNAAGYNENNFPTNGNVRAEYLGKTQPNTSSTSSSSSSTPTPAPPTSSTSTSPTTEPASTSGSLPGGLLGVGIKGFTYLALIAGAIAMLWLGSKTFLQPHKTTP
jgi:hypothetical protein